MNPPGPGAPSPVTDSPGTDRPVAGNTDPPPTATPGVAGSTAHHGALLDILMRETLDPGYAEAAKRRGQAPDRAETRRNDRLLTAAGALLVGLLLVVAYAHANQSAPTDARVRSDLRHRVVDAEHENASLARTAGTLQSTVNALGSSALGPGDTRRLAAAELAAGTTAVQGPGLRVVIDNPATSPAPSTGRRGTTGIGSVSLLTDIDVRSIVNELWTAGAEAIAVDNVRLTPTSAIRFAGQAVLVDFQPVAAPYTITAIGPSDVLDTTFTSSAVADRFRTLSSAYGFRFTTSQESDVHLPASTGGGPRYAHPETTSPTAAPTSAAPTSAATSAPTVGSTVTPSAGPTS